MPSDLVQLLVGGILLGGIYGLAAFGLSVTFGVLNILNLAWSWWCLALVQWLTCCKSVKEAEYSEIDLAL